MWGKFQLLLLLLLLVGTLKNKSPLKDDKCSFLHIFLYILSQMKRRKNKYKVHISNMFTKLPWQQWKKLRGMQRLVCVYIRWWSWTNEFLIAFFIVVVVVEILLSWMLWSFFSFSSFFLYKKKILLKLLLRKGFLLTCCWGYLFICCRCCCYYASMSGLEIYFFYWVFHIFSEKIPQ